jgi:hypothetical protein
MNERECFDYKYKFCCGCGRNIEIGSMERYETVDGFLYHCPVCDHPMIVENDTGVVADYVDQRKQPRRVDYSEFLPNVDQLNYLAHIVSKQEGKLQHALKQVHTINTKIQIMKELAKEQEKN